MELASQDAELKAALFRFVDVVPACRSLDDLARHLTGFLGEVETPPPPVAVAMRMGNTRAGRTALGAAAAAGVKHMAHRFIVGESPKAALGTLRDLWKDGVASLRRPARRGDRHAGRGPALRGALRRRARRRSPPPRAAGPSARRSSATAPAPLPRANLSVKVSALTPLLRPDAPERGKRDAADRLRGLLRRARELGAHLHIDMESLDSRDAVLELVLELLAEPEFRDGPSAGMVLQAYLRDSPRDARHGARLDRRRRRRARPPAHRAARQGRLLGPRDRRGRPARLDRAGVRGQGRLRPQLRAAHAPAARRRPALRVGDRVAQPALDRPRDRLRRAGAAATARDLELQVLRGLGDPLQHAIAAQGLRVRTYCPVGDLVAGMAYLVRRLLENTSNDSFLADQAKGVPLEALLAAP